MTLNTRRDNLDIIDQLNLLNERNITSLPKGMRCYLFLDSSNGY